MTENVTKWLTEIRTLQQQIANLTQERDQAYASATNWRRLYESEAQQRRRDAEQQQQQLEQVQQSFDNLRRAYQPADEQELQDIQQQIAAIHSVETLRSQLKAALEKCSQLAQALTIEQAAHTQTKDSLSNALGDTIDLLSKQQAND